MYALLTLLAIALMLYAIAGATAGAIGLPCAAFVVGLLCLWGAHLVDPMMRGDGE